MNCQFCGIAMVETGGYYLYEAINGVRIAKISCYSCHVGNSCHFCEHLYTASSVRELVVADTAVFVCLLCAGRRNISTCESCRRDFVAWLSSCRSCNTATGRNLFCVSCHRTRCAPSVRTRAIHEYSHHPKPVFHGSDNPYERFFGLEVEIDYGGHDEGNARSIAELSGGEKLFYIKTDGSLSNGLEIVTHPCTRKFHESEFPWEPLHDLVSELKYRADNTNTCGLHVHVNRSSMGETTEEQKLVMNRLFVLVGYKHWDKVLKFSRRELATISRWADRNYKMDKVLSSTALDMAGNCGKYVAINTRHSTTLEFRVFKGTIVPDRILASIQFVDGLVNVAQRHNLAWCAKAPWSEVIAEFTGDEVKAELEARHCV